MSNVEQKLQAMGLKLPACPAPVAAYLPVQTAGNLIYAIRPDGLGRRQAALRR
ncbi:MAG: hypothetical protein ACLUNO_09310 [Oscillospiraceae bacterium]